MDNIYTRINGYSFTYHPHKAAPAKTYVSSNIWEAYVKPSGRKVAAWHDCENMCRALDGFGLCITGAGCQTFSVMFDFAHPETGELMRAHITRDYNHLYHL